MTVTGVVEQSLRNGQIIRRECALILLSIEESVALEERRNREIKTYHERKKFYQENFGENSLERKPRNYIQNNEPKTENIKKLTEKEFVESKPPKMHTEANAHLNESFIKDSTQNTFVTNLKPLKCSTLDMKSPQIINMIDKDDHIRLTEQDFSLNKNLSASQAVYILQERGGVMCKQKIIKNDRTQTDKAILILAMIGKQKIPIIFPYFLNNYLKAGHVIFLKNVKMGRYWLIDTGWNNQDPHHNSFQIADAIYVSASTEMTQAPPAIREAMNNFYCDKVNGESLISTAKTREFRVPDQNEVGNKVVIKTELEMHFVAVRVEKNSDPEGGYYSRVCLISEQKIYKCRQMKEMFAEDIEMRNGISFCLYSWGLGPLSTNEY